MKIFVIFWLLIILAACSKAPQTFESAISLYNEKNQVAIPYIEEFARKGDYRAQVWLGWYYSREDSSNPQKSALYYKQAASAGEPDGQFFTGRNYLDGIGLPQNPKLAETYLLNAAEAEHSGAMVTLGDIYRNAYSNTKLSINEREELRQKSLHWYNKAYTYGSKQAAIWIYTLWTNAPLNTQNNTSIEDQYKNNIILASAWQNAHARLSGRILQHEGDIASNLDAEAITQANNMAKIIIRNYKTHTPVKTYMDFSRIYGK